MPIITLDGSEEYLKKIFNSDISNIFLELLNLYDSITFVQGTVLKVDAEARLSDDDKKR